MNIYKYKNYRELLSDYYQVKKAESGGRYSYRMMARISGYKSPNYLKLVIDGKRNLSKASIDNMIKLFELEQDQVVYFKKLIEHEIVVEGTQKDKIKNRIDSISAKELVQVLTTTSRKYLSSWWCPAVRELSLLPDFEMSASWISRKIFPRITVDQAQDAINILLDLEILKYDDVAQSWISCEGSMITDANQLSGPIKDIHQQYIQLGSESLSRFSHSEREVSSLTVALDEDSFRQAKRYINDFRFKMDVLLAKTKSPDSVYQLNLQFFPLSTSDWITSSKVLKEKEIA